MRTRIAELRWKEVVDVQNGSRFGYVEDLEVDLEDFIVSNNILPLGSLVYLLFCVSRRGWGWESFLAEANTGSGLKFPRGVRFYVTYVLPLIVLFIFVMGYWDKFF